MWNKRESTYILKWSKKIRAINLLGGKCINCGAKDPIVLEFHHDSDVKEFGMNDINLGRWSVIEKEIKICSLLCSNCHRELHCNYDGRHSAYKRELLEKMGFQGCCECGHWGKNMASITFHHRNEKEKKFIVSDALNRNISVSVADMFNEIEKCDIMCENCHRIKHFDVDLFVRLSDKIIEKSKNHKEIQGKIDRKIIVDMYVNKGMKQSEIRKKLGCAKSTICMALQKCLSK